jgi:RimJ/RimL family protein N-acetyltransferase
MTEAWTATLPGTAVPLRFDPADPDRHGELLHDWLHRLHVAPWWGPDRTVEQTRAYIARQRDSGHLVPWVVGHRDEPFGYVETYRPADDPLAKWFPVTPSDRGWHVLVGPPEVLGTGLPRLMGRAVLAYLLQDPTIDRVLCEPNELNSRMLAYCQALGYEAIAAVDLPAKRAQIMACSRDRFVERWPGDLEALT